MSLAKPGTDKRVDGITNPALLEQLAAAGWVEPEVGETVADEQVVVEAGTDIEPTDIVGETVTDEEAASLPVLGATEAEAVVEKPTRSRRK